jgi:hypothetical protein
MTRNKRRKEKELRTFPDHLDAQPIPATISSLNFDSTLEGCFAILGNQLACFERFS